MHRYVGLVLFAGVFAAAAQDTSKPQFTARELFYSAASESATPAKEAPKPAAPAPAPKKPVAQPKPAPAPPVKTAAVPTPAPSVPTPAVPTPSVPTAAPVVSTPASTPESGMFVKAALVTAPAPVTGTPLGIKYTILKMSGDDMVPVPPNTVFHTGDRIQLQVQTNGPGYLYVVTQGSSGTWAPLFPSPELADGDNHVDGWSAKVLPPKTHWAFDEKVGTERVFIVFSRTPEDGLENMIYSLQGGAAKPAADKTPAPAPPKKFVMTAAVTDAEVGRLRQTYTRDLVVETVDDKTPDDKSGEHKEYAVYVVNPTGSADSRVVAYVEMVHK